MRFGTMIPQGWKHDLAEIANDDQWDWILEAARAIDASTWDSLWVYDHFHTHPGVEHESVFDAWMLMSALAVATDRVRLGQMCTCVLYRPPSLLAKMAATVDSISHGRLDVGIGAGWSDKEFEAYGYDYPSNKVRLDMLEESAQILKTMWTTDNANFEGDHFQVRDAITRPLPIQRPHPPLWIAGGGEKRTLKIVAKYGDRSNFGDNVEDFKRKSQILEDHCTDVGRNFDEIGRSIHLMSVVGTDQADLDQKLEIAAKRRRSSPAEFAAEHLVGTVDQVADEVGRYAEAGCCEIILYFYDLGIHDSQEVFASEIIPNNH